MTYLDRNQGISAATNAAASLSTGEFIGLLDNDDELTADCLYRVAESIGKNNAEVYYSDERLIRADGSEASIFRKTKFNSELLLSHNYITHFLVISSHLFKKYSFRFRTA